MENIEVGQVWVCIETVRMNGSGEAAYIINKLYITSLNRIEIKIE